MRDRDSRELPVSNGRRGGRIVSSFESIDKGGEGGDISGRERAKKGEKN